MPCALAAQGTIAGQVTDAATGLPIEGAVVVLDVEPDDMTPEFSVTTDPFGFYTIREVPLDDYLLVVSHPAYEEDREDEFAVFAGDNKRNADLTFRTDLGVGSPDEVFDLFIQVNGAMTGVGLVDVPVVVTRFDPGDDSLLVDTLGPIPVDENGQAVLRGMLPGHYRIAANVSGLPGHRSLWDTFTTEGTVDDKVLLDGPHMMQVYLEPTLQTIEVEVGGADPVKEMEGPLKDVWVEVTGFSPLPPFEEVVPTVVGRTDEMGKVTFDGLPGVDYEIVAKRLGYEPEVALIPADSEGMLPPGPVFLPLTFVPREVVVDVKNPYGDGFIVDYIEIGSPITLAGVEGTNTEGILRAWFRPSPYIPGDPIVLHGLLPGPYKLLVTGAAVNSVEIDIGPNEPSSYTDQFFTAKVRGERSIEVGLDMTTEVEIAVEFPPIAVTGRLMAADRLASPDSRPAYLPVANTTVHFVERPEMKELAPAVDKDVTVTTDSDGRFSVTLMPSVYGITVDGMDDYWGARMIQTVLAGPVDPFSSFLGEPEEMPWPTVEPWPHAEEFSITEIYDINVTGASFGGYDAIDLELLLRKDARDVFGTITTTGGPDQVGILYSGSGFVYSTDYDDLGINGGTLSLVDSAQSLDIEVPAASSGDTRIPVVPPGDYTVVAEHPRYAFDTVPNVRLFDYPSPGRAADSSFTDAYFGGVVVDQPLVQQGVVFPSGEIASTKEISADFWYWNDEEDTYTQGGTGNGPDIVQFSFSSLYFPWYSPTVPQSATRGFISDGTDYYEITTANQRINTGGGTDDTAPVTPPTLSYTYEVEARLLQDPTKTVDGVNFIFVTEYVDGTTPATRSGYTEPPGVEKKPDADNWIWAAGSPRETTISGSSVTVRDTIYVDQGMEVIATVRNGATMTAIPSAPVELLASNGVRLRNFDDLVLDPNQYTKLTDATGGVTFSAVPGYRDYFLRIKVPGFEPRLHRLNAAAATEVTGEPGTNFRHTVTVDLTPLTPPSVTTTGVPFDRYGAFLPTVTRSGDESGFDGFSAADVLEMSWNLEFERQTHSVTLPGFDDANGVPMANRSLTLVDDIVEVWLVDQRMFTGSIHDDESVPFPVPPATDPLGVRTYLGGLSNPDVSALPPKRIFFRRTNEIQPGAGGGEAFKASGSVSMAELPVGDFAPAFVVVSEMGAVAVYDVPYTGDDEAKKLQGVPIPSWLSFAFDAMGVSAGVVGTVGAAQEELMKFVPDGRYLPLPEFSASITKAEDGGNETGYVDYNYSLTLLQREGQDMPGQGLTGLAPGLAGAEFKSVASISMPGAERKLSLSIENSISKEEIPIEGFSPKLLKGFDVEAQITGVSGSVTTTGSKNVDPSSPWDVRLTNETAVNLDAEFKMNLEPVLGKIPYVGPVLTALDKTGGLQVFGTTEAGIGVESNLCWQTTRPVISPGTTTDPDPRQPRQHFLGGDESVGPDADLDCNNSFALCLRFGVGLDVEALGGRAGGSGRIRLTGSDEYLCAGQPAVKVTPNTFGDWPPIKRIQGKATADINGYLDTPIKRFEKDWSWDLLEFDAQFGTETVYQLIPMSITTTATDITAFATPVYNGAAPVLIDGFLPLASYETTTGRRLLFTDFNGTSGEMELKLAAPSGETTWDSPQVLASAAAILHPSLATLADGSIVVAWAELDAASADDPDAIPTIKARTSDMTVTAFGTEEALPDPVAPIDGLAVAPLGADAVVAVLERADGLHRVRGSARASSVWGAWTDWFGPARVNGWDLAGSTASSEAHLVTAAVLETGADVFEDALRTVVWDGSTTPVVEAIDVGSWPGPITAGYHEDDFFRVVAQHRQRGLEMYATSGGGTPYAIAPGFSAPESVGELAMSYLPGDPDPALLLAWTSRKADSTTIRYVHTGLDGTPFGPPIDLTRNTAGAYSAPRLVSLDADSARLFALFENSPIELRTFRIDPDGYDANDVDSDGMNDVDELRIADADPDDAITAIDQVLIGDDFDMDGFGNKAELDAGSDPIDSASTPETGGLPVVTVLAGTGSQAAEYAETRQDFVISRTGDTTAALDVLFSITGTAGEGTDYAAIGTSARIAAAESDSAVTVSPILDAIAEGTEDVVLTIGPDAAYSVGTPSSATITIDDLPFFAWRFTEFAGDPNGAATGEGDDPDGDSLDNLAEYALQLDPLGADVALLPTVDFHDDPATGDRYLELVFSFEASPPDIAYIVEVGSGLESTDWSSAPEDVELVSNEVIDGRVVIRMRDRTPFDPSGENPRFIRLRIHRGTGVE